jgi:hypothetical protein
MDFTQSKLTKSEWVSIETPVSENEVNILNIILNGYDNIGICVNKNKSLLQILNIEYNPTIDFNKPLIFTKTINIRGHDFVDNSLNMAKPINYNIITISAVIKTC